MKLFFTKNIQHTYLGLPRLIYSIKCKRKISLAHAATATHTSHHEKWSKRI